LIEENRAVVREFVLRAGALTPEQWITKHAPDKWSPAQQTAHVILTHRGFTAEVREGPEVDRRTFSASDPELIRSVLPRILLGHWFPSGGTSPASALPTEFPGEQDTLLSELVRSAIEFEDALQSAAVVRPDRHARHPFFGALTLSELLRFNVEHTRHHLGFLPDVTR
jgi:hypothetical protein